MNPENRSKLEGRVVKAAEAALTAQNYVSPIDVLLGIGWLDPGAVKRWRQGQVDHLERTIQANLSRISEAMKLFRSWAAPKGLVASDDNILEAIRDACRVRSIRERDSTRPRGMRATAL